MKQSSRLPTNTINVVTRAAIRLGRVQGFSRSVLSAALGVSTTIIAKMDRPLRGISPEEVRRLLPRLAAADAGAPGHAGLGSAIHEAAALLLAERLPDVASLRAKASAAALSAAGDRLNAALNKAVSLIACGAVEQVEEWSNA